MKLSQLMTMTKDGEPEINPVLLGFKVFSDHRELCKRVYKTSWKEQHTKELAYLFFMMSRDQYDGLGKEAKSKGIMKRLDLKEGWVVSNALQLCIDMVETDTTTPQAKTITTVKRQLLDYVDYCEMLSDMNREALRLLKGTDSADDTPEEKKEKKEALAVLRENLDSILDFAQKLPKAVSMIEELEVKLSQSNSGSTIRLIGRTQEQVNPFEKV
jgi:hypothetical protein